MQEPTILVVQESNEGMRIQEHSKVQRTNKILKIEEPLKAQEFKWILKVHKTTSQREVYEYGDQDVTKILVLWKISIDDDANHNSTMWAVLKGRAMFGISYLL